MSNLRIVNNFNTTLVNNITAQTTELILTSVAGHAVHGIDEDYSMLTITSLTGEREIVKVTSWSDTDNKAIVERAQEGTSALAFSAGSRVGCRFTAGSMRTYLESWHIREEASVTRVDDTHFTVAGDKINEYKTDRSLRIYGDTVEDIYVKSSTYTAPLTTVETLTNLPTNIRAVELGPDVDWMPQHPNVDHAANADLAQRALNADNATNATSSVNADNATTADNALLLEGSNKASIIDDARNLKWSFTDASSRTSATGILAGDINKLARQEDNNSIWLLVNNSPLTWEWAGGNLGEAASYGVGTSAGELVKWEDLPEGGASDQQENQIYLNATRLIFGLNSDSGDLAGGYQWTFKTDELPTKTDAAYVSNGGYYSSVNASGINFAVGGTPTFSSFYSTRNKCWDNDGPGLEQSWQSQVGVPLPHWTAYQLPNSATKTLESYKLSSVASFQDRMPKTWVMQGSNNGTDWIDLDTQTDVDPWSNGEQRTFVISNPSGSYNRFRLYITAFFSSNEVIIGEIDLFGLTVSNMTLQPNPVSVGSSHNKIDMYLAHRSAESVTMGSDLQVRLSKDNGVTWSDYKTAPSDYKDISNIDTSWKLWKVVFDTSSLSDGTQFKWEVKTLNTKRQDLGTVLQVWK